MMKYIPLVAAFVSTMICPTHAHATPKRMPSLSTSIHKCDIGSSRIKLQQYKNQIHLTPKQLETSIGILLGDGCLQTQNKGETYRIKFEYSQKNKHYVDHLTQVFDSFILSKPKERCRINRYNHEVKTFQFQTISHQDFVPVASGFKIPQGKKSIHVPFLETTLTHRSIAYWFMDDGGKLDYTANSGKGIVFHTQSFSLSEVEDLCNILENQFGYIVWPKKNKNKHIIAVSGKCYDQITSEIYPYILPAMQYKWPKSRKS